MTDEINFSDLSSLQSRINDIKKEGEEIVDFTLRYIECLMYRHSLPECIPAEAELDFCSDVIFDQLKNGIIPTKEELIIMSAEEQNQLVFELIWFCGMGALVAYGADEDSLMLEESEEDEISEISTFEMILSMRNQSMAHYSATYIIAALALLMCQIPSHTLIASLTNNYEDSESQIQANMNIFMEFASAILDRYQEDQAYFSRDVSLEELAH